jgi:HPt (histidine-containing phosphotransfer) domain-containing protein
MPDTSTTPAHRPIEPPGLRAAAAAGACALDPQAVEQLRQLDPSGANRLIARVVDAYRGSAEKLVPQLRDAMARGDHAGVRLVAHTLKSSSQNVGASQLALLCASVEAMVRTGETTGLEEAVRALCVEVDRAVAALGQLQEVRA